MFGKHFASMYSGSMVGSGALTFAVWGYVIAHMVPDGVAGSMSVELNPKLLGPILGEPVKDVQAVIEKLCGPDAESRSKEEGGRRLVRLGQFDYRVVNGMKYREMRDQENRRRQLREAQERFRVRQRPRPGTMQPGEPRVVAMARNGDSDEAQERHADRVNAERLDRDGGEEAIDQ